MAEASQRALVLCVPTRPSHHGLSKDGLTCSADTGSKGRAAIKTVTEANRTTIVARREQIVAKVSSSDYISLRRGGSVQASISCIRTSGKD